MGYINESYLQVIGEFCDMNDDETRQHLLCLDESEREGVLNSLALRFYSDIMNKVDDIDFGTIPESKGDITLVENYNEMMNCLSTLRGILTEFKQKTTQLDEIELAITNIANNRKLFEKAFKVKADIPVITYCTLVYAVVCSVSLMMTSSVDFIKSPTQDNFTISFDRTGYLKTGNSMMYKNLVKFNNSVKKGDFEKSLDYLINGTISKKISEDTELMGDVALDEGFFSTLKSVATAFADGASIDYSSAKEIGKTAIGLLNPKNVANGIRKAGSTILDKGPIAVAVTAIISVIALLWLIRWLIYKFYHTRVKLSDYFEAQADIMQMNAYILENNNTDGDENKIMVIKKQTALSERFRSLSNFFAIKEKEGEVKTQKQFADEEKYKIGDLQTDGAGSLF